MVVSFAVTLNATNFAGEGGVTTGALAVRDFAGEGGAFIVTLKVRQFACEGCVITVDWMSDTLLVNEVSLELIRCQKDYW